MRNRRISRGGFALPTVLIASVVMLTILVVSVSSVAAVRVTLKTQYYEQLAKSAGEAGIAYAKACLSKNGNVPLWTNAKPLRPSTDCAGNSLLTPAVETLIVAGGGSGGSGTGGGGGGGGVLYSDSVDVSATGYSIVVGAGGASPALGTVGNNGSNSSAFGMTATGGGGGAFSNSGGGTAPGRNGGSGGGGQNYNGNNLPGTGILGQGYAGGPLGTTSGGGGGGAGGTGTAGSGQYVGGSGGPGLMYSISGSNVFYAGGGGGAGNTNGTSGKPGVGGATGGAETVASNATPNTGGGGGGGWTHAAGRGGAGGSGVVVIRYGNDGSINATGGVISYSGPYKIHTFTANGTFNISNAQVATCPTAARCSVVVYDNIRSSFSVGRPTLNEQGKAVAIPNTGYVELLRESTGEVWRTYRQPSVQAAVVPDLCSGAASTGLGWSNAIRTAAQDSIPNAPGAVTISLADNALPAGKMFFRKDFVVSETGTYDVGILTGSPSDSGDVYIDGVYEVNSTGTYASTQVPLTAGCHTITVQLSNQTVVSRRSDFTASIQRNNSAPILVTDTNWRVAAGASVHFSQPDFYADPAIWDPVTTYTTGTAQAIIPGWQSAQNDIWTVFISPSSNGCPSACPGTSSMYLRDSKDFYLANNTEVLVSALCDDDCAVYLDGEEIIANSPWSNINQQTLTLTAGAHHLAIRLSNHLATANPSGAAASVIVKDTGTILTRTDRSWVAASTFVPGVGAEIYSYEASFVPSPSEIPEPTRRADVLVVGGGGGGGNNAAGGGGGGGVRNLSDIQLTPGTYAVTVGAGGAMATSVSVRGSNGSNSVFGSYTSLGGGGGASRDGGTAASTGGSGGGGSGPTVAGREIGAAGTSGQGYAGGNGTAADQGGAAKGGGGGGASGAGVAATTAVAGNGGAGFISYITGSLQSFGGGGGGSNTAGNGSLGAATDGATSGNSATAIPANRGGGGGAGNANGGGSGVVIVRFKTGTMSVSATGTYTVTSPTIGGIPYTVYRFTGNGTFVVS